MLTSTTLAIMRGIIGLAMDVSGNSRFYLYSSFCHDGARMKCGSETTIRQRVEKQGSRKAIVTLGTQC